MLCCYSQTFNGHKQHVLTEEAALKDILIALIYIQNNLGLALHGKERVAEMPKKNIRPVGYCQQCGTDNFRKYFKKCQEFLKLTRLSCTAMPITANLADLFAKC